VFWYSRENILETRVRKTVIQCEGVRHQVGEFLLKFSLDDRGDGKGGLYILDGHRGKSFQSDILSML
jgi:hypothetical protein